VPVGDRDVAVAAFAPSGRYLAVGTTTHESAVYERSGDGWALSRPWRRELEVDMAELVEIDVDDAGTTLAYVDGRLGSALRWRSRGGRGDIRMAERGGVLAGGTLTLVPDDHKLRIADEDSGDVHQAALVAAPADSMTIRRVGISPSGDRAVVAGPDGLFSVLDLRAVRSVREGVVTASPSVHRQRLSALVPAGDGARMLSWDLGERAAGPAAGPIERGQPRVAVQIAGGRMIASSSDRDEIAIRRTSDGAVVGRLWAKGGESWFNLAADDEGRLLAAVDIERNAVTLWSLRAGADGSIGGQVEFRGPSFGSSSVSELPLPVAVHPSGEALVYGADRGIVIRSLGDGSERSVSTRRIGKVVRARFSPDGDRVLLATTRGVSELAGDGWSAHGRLSSQAAHDAVALPAGDVAVANGDGVQLLPADGGDPITLSEAVSADGIGPGTLSASPDNDVLVPHSGPIPLTVLRAPRPSVAVLCALAGGRETGDAGCARAPALPVARAPRATAADNSDDTVLSADGLGWLRLDAPLPAAVAAYPAYRAGPCTVRQLPRRGAAVVAHDGRVETIGLSSSLYAAEDASYREPVEVATDRGLTGAITFMARDLYGRPDDEAHGTMRWWLDRPGGGHSLFEVHTRYRHQPSVTMSVERPRCAVWR
jgi:hypothetical protein